MKTAIFSLLILGPISFVSAAIRTETVTYKQGKTVCEGFLAYDDEKTGKLPGVLVIHEWKGLGDHVKTSATKLAELGYVAFAADIYGKGIRPATTEEASKTSSIYKNDRALMRTRAKAGLDVLRKNTRVDSSKLAAMGYCFGGTVALELARSGEAVSGVVSFHGGLNTPTPTDAKNIKGKVLVLHGADDPYVPGEEVSGFEKEMREAGVDWQLIKYSGAVHSFTNPEAGSDNSKGAAYNETAAKRSWKHMKGFFKEIFE